MEKFDYIEGSLPSSLSIIKCCIDGNLERLKYHIKNGEIASVDAICCAVRSGQFQIVKYLVSIGAPINNWATFYAHKNKRSAILKYLLIVGAPCWSEKESIQFREELRLELSQPVSEYIGLDISSIILQKLL